MCLFNDPATTAIYTLSLHDALPIFRGAEVAQPQPAGLRHELRVAARGARVADHEARALDAPQHERAVDLHHAAGVPSGEDLRSEEHTSELQSQSNLVCRLLLEKKKE